MFGLERASYDLFPPSLIDEYSLYLASSNWLLLLLCAFFCTSLTSRTARRLGSRRPLAAGFLSVLSNLLLLAVVLAFMV